MLALFLAAALAAPDSARSLLKTLVETDTTLASGSCTRAADAMKAVLVRTGFPEADLTLFADPAYPREGGLVATLGSGKAGLLLVSHLDTVEADPSEWTHPPFKLTEQAGYLHGRGVVDAKGVAALLVDTVIRLRHAKLRRPVRIALTCGEESPQAHNGVAWLARHRRDLIDADLALVPTGGATLDAQGRAVAIAIAAGEKTQQVYRVEARGQGAHASRPTPDNAIYTLADGLGRLRDMTFPITLTQTARAQLRDESADQPEHDAVERLLRDPADAQAAAIVSARPAWNAIIRTTCAPTVIDTGRQPNTIASRASALINCRLLPGESLPAVEARLRAALGDNVTLAPVPPLATPAPAPSPLKQIGTIAAVARQVWPGISTRQTLLTGATDARHLNAAGIPAYGLTILFIDPDGNGVHAANERVRIRSFEQAGDFLYRLILSHDRTPG